MKVITVGRSSDNDIVINDSKVSRAHLQIVQNDSGVCSVVDLNSANGTYVNDQKITGELILRPQDIIRIGDTTLPWLEYIIQPTPINKETGMASAVQTSKSNRRWLWVAICVSIAFCAGIGIYFYLNKGGNQQPKNLKQPKDETEERMRQEAEHLESIRVQDKADEELYRQALRKDRDNNRKLAEAKQKEATEAKRQAEAATEARKKAELAKIAAEKAKEDADKAKASAMISSQEAIKSADEKANQAISAANTERDAANEKARLTEKFYQEYAVMKSDFAKEVCEQLNVEVTKKTDAREILKELFNQSDNKGKKAIVDAIQAANRQKDKTKK